MISYAGDGEGHLGDDEDAAVEHGLRHIVAEEILHSEKIIIDWLTEDFLLLLKMGIN